MRTSRLLQLFVVALVLALAQTRNVALSSDGGTTWSPVETANTEDLPPHILLRAAEAPRAPMLHLPSCAAEPGLRVDSVRFAKGGPPVGLRWRAAPGCRRDDSDTSSTFRVRIADVTAPPLEPDWFRYVRDTDAETGDGEENGNGKQGGWFSSKYLLYIMGLVGVALAQGIRKGLAELREEMAQEEAEKKGRKGRAGEGQVRVMVPQRKKSTKGKRRVTAAAANADGGK